jgi:GDPmannose 4,6-dehydratase
VILKNDFTPEYKALVSDPALIFSLGWKPEVSFEALAKMMIPG